ncbi:carboxypeptidase M32 [Gorillibacterium massiliense]|uniref:carboxypeptidase M32 n=1 Tax=Gorillibacterium massiliense TaxID=1280390 RepID=UPI003B5122EE
MVQEKVQGFRDLVKRICSYNEAISIMYWDLRTGAPRKGVEDRSESLGLLSTDVFKMSTSAEMGDFLSFIEQTKDDTIDPLTRKMAEDLRKDYDRMVKIPPDMYREYVILTSQAETIWTEAKNASDYPKFRPYLEKIIEFNKQFIELYGYEGHKYNALLDMYEPGLTVEKLDKLFGTLRDRTVPLVKAISESPNKPDASFLKQSFPIEKQKAFNRMIVQEMGYDFAAGRLDETEHPFEITINQGDVRITTRYVESDFTFALFSTVHEGGHALYEQNIDPELKGTNLSSGTSMGIHESQSRFWENMVARSPEFWIRYYGDLQKAFPEQLQQVSQEDFIRAVNVSESSLIRIEADELTYNLHIIIRYEIEKALFEGSIHTEDLPAVWNQKYKEYLGVEPDSDKTGILQDTHWSGGSFGYFPSYALGNMYAAQIRHTLKKEMPDMDEKIAKGDLLPIKDWLKEKIYRYGKKLTPNEIIMSVTGEELNPLYLVEYLEEKYKAVYKL